VLATNLFIATLTLLLVIGVIAWLAARPALRRMSEDCERIDAVKEAQRAEEEREREMEARLRARAVKEVEEEFPRLHEIEGSNDHH
jgi:flagellar biosynthesis/type III secretory pathway M-ring protein FliF/YscJ